MPAITRSTGRGKRLATINPAPRRQPKKVTLAQHMKRSRTDEGRESIQTHLDRPNQLMRLQGEFEMGMARLEELQRLEREQKQLLAKLFEKIEGRAFQAYMKDEVVDLEEEITPEPDSPLTDYESPPPGLAPLRLPMPAPFIDPPVPRRQDTPYPLRLREEEEEEEEQLQYPGGCAVCLYDEERCAGCLRRIWGIRN